MMLFLGKKIAHLKTKCPHLKVIFNGWEHHPYASHMGFFDLCGFVHGKTIGQAWGSKQYLPITRLKKEELYEKDFDKYEEMQDLVQRRVDRISEVVTRDPERRSVFFDALSFSIREVFRNVFEHGETDELYYCAQYWPKSDKVEFAVGDAGIGIRTSLGQNPNFRFNSDKAALEAALLPSVSGKTHQPRRSENWFNSGYGLYMINRLARNGGSFVIASGESAICLTPRTKTNFTTSFNGTILRVSFRVSEIGDVQKRLAEFRKDGAEIATMIKGSGNRPPSAMSMLLRRDYR
ncbi:hypothetical protein [Neotabrizicola sp. VNH66]|uniref:hypothetical protein n=1 Tax=Neotabrizicola sp. VNH66 TaxID=3400918 RepID=UPI003C10E483